jgi:hypothetical protein
MMGSAGETMAEQSAKAKADELKQKHAQIDESGDHLDGSDEKTNPSDRANTGDAKGHSQIDESGAET